MSFFKLQVLPETLEFRIAGEKFIDNGINTSLGESYLSQQFMELSTGVLLPLTEENQERIGIDDKTLKAFDNREITLCYDFNKTNQEYFLMRFQNSSFYSSRKVLQYLEQRFGVGLEGIERNQVEDIIGLSQEGSYLTTFPISLSSANQLYLPDVVSSRRFMQKFPNKDFSQGYVNGLENGNNSFKIGDLR